MSTRKRKAAVLQETQQDLRDHHAKIAKLEEERQATEKQLKEALSQVVELPKLIAKKEAALEKLRLEAAGLKSLTDRFSRELADDEAALAKQVFMQNVADYLDDREYIGPLYVSSEVQRLIQHSLNSEATVYTYNVDLTRTGYRQLREKGLGWNQLTLQHDFTVGAKALLELETECVEPAANRADDRVDAFWEVFFKISTLGDDSDHKFADKDLAKAKQGYKLLCEHGFEIHGDCVPDKFSRWFVD